MITLAIDTASMPSTIALLKGDLSLGIRYNEEAKQTSSIISQHIDDLVKNHLNSIREIDRIAVNIGPGSFTGLRVGLATAKGLAMAIDCEFVALNMFEVMVHNYLKQNKDSTEYIYPIINANNNKIFISKYYINKNMFDDAVRYAINHAHLAWEGEKNKTLLPLNQGINGKFVPSGWDCTEITCTANEVGEASIGKMALSRLDLAYVEPFYIINNYKTKT